MISPHFFVNCALFLPPVKWDMSNFCGRWKKPVAVGTFQQTLLTLSNNIPCPFVRSQSPVSPLSMYVSTFLSSSE